MSEKTKRNVLRIYIKMINGVNILTSLDKLFPNGEKLEQTFRLRLTDGTLSENDYWFLEAKKDALIYQEIAKENLV